MKITNKPSNIIIVLCVAIGFMFSFSIAYLILSSKTNELTAYENQFYNTNKTNIVFILGSSQTGHLNTTYINQKVSSKGKDYDIYNLSIINDRPAQRLSTIDDIISSKPKLIIYGIGIRDFEDEQSNSINFLPNTNPKQLPDIKSSILKIININKLGMHDMAFIQPPRDVTLEILSDLIHGNNQTDKLKFKNTPFFHPRIKDVQVNMDYNPSIEYNSIIHSFKNISPPVNNIDYTALKSIIQKLKQNGIDIIVFTTPYKKEYLDLLPEKEKYQYNNIILDLQHDKNILFYSLNEKYYNYSNIWTDYNHVALDPTINIYNDDVSNMILNEKIKT